MWYGKLNFYRIFLTWCWINTKVFIGFTIPSACTQIFTGIRNKLYSGRVSCYMLMKYEEEQKNFLISKGVSGIHIRKILFDATLIILERTMYLAICCCYYSIDFKIPWSDGKHIPKVRTVNINMNINVYVRCFAIILGQENIWFFFILICLCTDLYFLCECFFIPVINFTPFTRVLVIKT